MAKHFQITPDELRIAEAYALRGDAYYQPELNEIVTNTPHFEDLMQPALESIRSGKFPPAAIRYAAMHCYALGLEVGMQIAANRAALAKPAP